MMNLKTKIFADGADLASMTEYYRDDLIKGLTTNPTLMRKAGIKNYKEFCLTVLDTVKSKPISFEVFSDDFDEMAEQAREISKWGNNVFVKIPASNTSGRSSVDLVQSLVSDGVRVNVTAVTTVKQAQSFLAILDPKLPSYLSVFAGRIADTGIDPELILREILESMKSIDSCEMIWASPRELFNLMQAERIGCHIITLPSDLLKKLPLLGYDLNQYSVDTVQQFYDDSVNAGYSL